MSDELVERLLAFEKLVDVAAHHPTAYLKPDQRHVDDLREAIAALSATPSEDVNEAMLEVMLTPGANPSIAALLQRLDRRIHELEVMLAKSVSDFDAMLDEKTNQLDLVTQQLAEAMKFIEAISVAGPPQSRAGSRNALARIRAMSEEEGEE